MSKAVSYSRHGMYNKCPASYEWQYVLGNKQDYNPGPAAQRGTRIHDSIEQAFLLEDPNHFDQEIPDKVRLWLMEEFNCAVAGKCEARPEMQFCLDSEWNPVDFDSEDGYIRGFIDNVFVYPERVHAHEYKTGKEYDDHVHQKQLYAMVLMLLFPDVPEVVVEGIYIDQGKRVPTTYSRAHLNSMKFHWKLEIDKMFVPIYPARPGMHCRWCPKSHKHNDGPCKVG